MPSPALARLRPSLPRLLPALVTLIALWLIASGALAWWLPNALRAKAVDWARQHGRTLEIGTVSINPLLWTVNMDGIRLADRDGSPLLTLKALALEAKPSALLLGRWQLNELDLDTPSLSLTRSGNNWNWQQLLAELAGPPQPQQADSPPPKIRIDHLAITRGRIQIKDGSRNAPAWRLAPVELTLTELSTLPVDGGYRLSATLDDGARFDWQGSLRLAPLSSAGQLRISGLTLARAWPLLPADIKLAAPQGTFDADARYRLALEPKLALELTPFNAALHGLRLDAPGQASRLSLAALTLRDGRFSLDQRQLNIGTVELNDGALSARRDGNGRLDWQAALQPSQAAPAQPVAHPAPAAPWRFDIGQVAFRNWQLGLRDESRRMPLELKATLPEAGFRLASGANGPALSDLHAGLAQVSLGDGHGKAPIRLAEAKLEPGLLDLGAQHFTPGRLSLSGLELELERDRAGKLNLATLFSPRAGAVAPAKPKADKQEAGWRVTPPAVTLRGGNVRWHDAATAQPVSVTLSALEAEGTSNPDDQLALKLNGRIGSGKLAGDLNFATRDGSAAGMLELDRLPLVPLAPYALSGTTLHMASGSLSGRLKLLWPANGAWKLNGSAAIDRFALFEPAVRDPLIAWNQLKAEQLAVGGGKGLTVGLERLRFDTPRLRLILDQQRHLNLVSLFAANGKGAQSESSQTTAAKPAGGPALQLAIRSIAVANGELDFADHSLSEQFFTRIHHLSGYIQGISSQPGRRGTVTLDGRVDNFGAAKVRGTLAPFAPTDSTDLLLALQNIPMASISPYSVTFAGWHVDDGRLNLDLRYHVKNRELQGSNNVVIQSIKLGDEVVKPGATRLPLRLAVALLEDSDGRIELNLPVSGRLDDPQFSYGHLMWQAFTNVVEKVATAPFRALANLFGHEGFDGVYFAVGQSSVSPPEQEKLAKLATLLQKRPAISVTLAGTVDRDSEAKALARARVDSAILTAAGQPPEAGLPLAIPDVDDDATRKAIRSVYGDRFGRMKLLGQVLGSGDGHARYQDLRRQLIEAEQGRLDDKAFNTLAAARAEAARREILRQDPTLAGRVKLAAPEGAHAEKDGVPLSIKLDKQTPPA
jgi:uncharacterized protein involved in outer membrane biogenesis